MSLGIRNNNYSISLLALIWAILLLMTGCGGGGGGSGNVTATPKISSIIISPINISIARAATASLKAMATYPDGSTADVTTQVVWSSDSNIVAGVGISTGVVTGLSAGAATITASLYGVTSTVPASIVVTPTGGIVASPLLATARWDHTASLLLNGKVLVAAGGNGGEPECACAAKKAGARKH